MPPSQYETFDVYLASYLLYSGASLQGYDHVTHRRVVFRFAADERLHALLRAYWGYAPIPMVPTLLFGALRELKSRVRRKPGKLASASEPAGDMTGPSGSSFPILPC